uniref:Uncharacterized protein n=1 Tax=Photinus pyralis TaxID=7054 RepID=A0A1Y1MLR3_PHOPY
MKRIRMSRGRKEEKNSGKRTHRQIQGADNEGGAEISKEKHSIARFRYGNEKLEGNIHIHNAHFWSQQNPHWLREVSKIYTKTLQAKVVSFKKTLLTTLHLIPL